MKRGKTLQMLMTKPMLVIAEISGCANIVEMGGGLYASKPWIINMKNGYE